MKQQRKERTKTSRPTEFDFGENRGQNNNNLGKAYLKRLQFNATSCCKSCNNGQITREIMNAQTENDFSIIK